MATLKAPTGEVMDVPDSLVAHYVSRGAVVVASSDQTRVGAAPAANRNADWRRSAANIGTRAIPALAAGGAALATGGASIPVQLMAMGLAGAGGEGVRQAISTRMGNREPAPFSPEAGARIALAGAEQAGAGGAGMMLQRGARTGALNLMRQALKPTVGLQEAAGANMTATARRMFPEGEDIWETAINERVPVGQMARSLGSRRGSEKVAAKLAETGSMRDHLLEEAARGGWSKTAHDFVGYVDNLRQDIARQTNPEKPLAALNKMVREFVDARRVPGSAPGRMGKLQRFTPQEVQQFKQTWQQEAQPLYKAQASGVPIGPRQALKSRFAEATARGAREQLETIPGVAGANARLQRLQLLKDAVDAAERRNRTLRWSGPGHIFPALEWPELSSRVALGLTGRTAQGFIGQVPRMGDLALQEFWNSQEDR